MPRADKKTLGREMLAKCVVRGNLLEKDECALRLSADVALVLDLDEEPLKSEMADEGKRCDFAAYQRPNPLNGRPCLVLMEFKAKLHNVNEALMQLGGSLEFLARWSALPELAFDRHASVLVCAEEIGPRKIQRLKDAKVVCLGVSTLLRPLVLASGDKLTDEQIAERMRPVAKKGRKG